MIRRPAPRQSVERPSFWQWPRATVPRQVGLDPRRPATENQIRAIRSIAARQHADLDGLLRDYGVSRPEDLSLRQASELIDVLKTAASI